MADYTFVPRWMNPPEGSYFLFGPRGTGKSTWLLHHYPKAVRIDLLLGDEERRFSGHPERIREAAHAMQPGSTLIIDEIQRVPRLLPEIHALMEEKRQIQFIMTGSSARKLRRAVSDLLGGRALLRQMGPFYASELGDSFVLEKALRIGLIPLIWESTNPLERLRNYLNLYLKEEVHAEALFANLGIFPAFWRWRAFLMDQYGLRRPSAVKPESSAPQWITISRF